MNLTCKNQDQVVSSSISIIRLLLLLLARLLFFIFLYFTSFSLPLFAFLPSLVNELFVLFYLRSGVFSGYDRTRYLQKSTTAT